MAHAEFVHLRVHSAYSLSEGALKLKTMIEMAKAGRMPALAITDTNNLFGALEFALAAAEAGVQPIIGCQFAIRRPEGGLRGGKPARPDQLVLLAQNEAGYRNLMRLSSACFIDSDPAGPPQLALEAVEARAAGLIALTGGPEGVVGRLLVDGQAEAAEAMLVRLARAFPGRLYVELMRHGTEAEGRIEADLVDFAYRHDVPLVATNDVHFADESVYEAHDALLCVAEGRHVAEHDRRRLTPEHGFKSAAQMREVFADLPEAIDNTVVIARRCSFMPRPSKPIFPVAPRAREKGAAATLRELARAGLERRLVDHVLTASMSAAEAEAIAKPYRERLAYELEVIIKMGFDGYFLIVADFIQWARDQGIPVGPGRGSGAGSVVAWSLTITDLDPLRFGLIFERFLNPERVSMPDFDIDFCQDRRDEVIRYVQQEYGRDRVAQIITFGKLQARAVLRDVGRVLGMAYGHVDRICKLVPNNPANPVSLQQAIDGEKQLQDMRDNDEAVARLIDIALKLEGLYRHASTHAAGVVIGDRPLDELVPLYRDPRSPMLVTQFNMKYVEQAGLVKFDFLGLKTLTVLDRAVALLKARGVAVDLARLPLDDKKTYDMLARADTVGVFQLESSGMRDAVRRLRPDRIEDLIALVALYRPGPMDDIPRYIACKHGTERPDYLHPSLEPVLKETYGVIVYQEQVLQIAQILSGFSLGSADLLRRAMGKKIKAEMDAQRKAFVDGAIARGVQAATAEHIFSLVAKFAGYGFNKGHSAPYGLIAYQTAWFKANHPVEFFAASMTLDMGNTDKLNVFRQELDRMGVKLLAPDINRSEATFSVEDGAVRYGLAAVRNVGLAAMNGLVAERRRGDAFKSLDDFASRLDVAHVNKRQLEALAKAGALDALEPSRARAHGAIEAILARAASAQRERESQQESLFTGKLANTGIRAPALAEWPLHDRLRHEFEAIGFYLSAHPLDAYAAALKRLGAIRASDLVERLAAGGSQRVKLAGTVIGKQERTSAKGNRFAFVQLSDSSGIFELTVFSEQLVAARDLLGSGQPLLISADARIDEEQVRLTAQSVQSLAEASAHAAAGLRIVVGDEQALSGLARALSSQRRGRGRVALVVDAGEEGEVEIALAESYAVSAGMLATVQSLPGVKEVVQL